MEKRFHRRGGWSETEGGCLFLCLQFGRFTQGAQEIARKSRSEKSAASINVVWQGSISVETGLEAGELRMQSATTRLRSEPSHSVSRYGFLSW